MNVRLTYLILVLCGFAACDIINPDEPIPAYLKVDQLRVAPEPAQGSASSKVTEVYAYVDNEFLGVFPLPAEIPVLATGEPEVLLFPGIKNNGISDASTIFPFYERFSTNPSLTSGETTTLDAKVGYVDNAVFTLVESFDGVQQTFTFDQDQDPASKVEITNGDVFEGSGSGFIKLTKNTPIIVTATRLLENLPVNGTPVYLEMDYKNEVDFFVGIIAYDAIGERIYQELNRGVIARDDWNKIYFNLEDLLITGRREGAVSYRIGLAAALPIVEGEFSQEEGRIWLDNVKLVHY